MSAPQLNITWPACACCGEPAQGNHSIHRDGFAVGPEVALCDACGGAPTPTCEEIWDRIELRGRARIAAERGEALGLLRERPTSDDADHEIEAWEEKRLALLARIDGDPS